MIYTTETLLPTNTTFTGSPIVTGNAVIGASYYGNKVNGIQTATINTTGFVGNIKLQATLYTLAEQAQWFDVDMIDASASPLTGTTAVTLIGNFVWVRARVEDFSAGTVNTATLTF